MHWAEASHSEKQNQISRSNSVPIFSELSLTEVAVVVKTFANVLFLLWKKFFPRVYLAKQHNSLANRKSYAEVLNKGELRQ